METWETGWEVAFTASTADELLLALVVRDLVHGTSFDVEVEEDSSAIELDFVAGDEYEDDSYLLLLSVEVRGTDNREIVQAFTEQMLEEMVGEAETLTAEREELDTLPAAEVVFRAVPEDEERWDLVIPDWLAPDGAEVPFGFRPFVGSGNEPWPSNDQIDSHGRVMLIPDGDSIRLVGIPAPAEWGDGESDGLPVHPDPA
ncbi:MAG: hypothetical protein PVG92_02135 [Holophagae bacterium]|jgi:hypothetical protein